MPTLGTFDQIIAQLNSPLILNPGSGWHTNALTYSFSKVVSPDSAGTTESESFSPLNADQRAAVRLVMAAYSDVIDVQFTEVSAQQGNAGDIRFANFLGGANSAFSNGVGPGYGGDIFISVTPPPIGDVRDPLHPLPGTGSFKTLLHEMGHSMGLYHPGDYNGGSPTWAADAMFVQDTNQYTVMSYFGASDYANGNDLWDPQNIEHFPQTLMMYDIAALQATYGANLTTRAGSTVYGFNSTIDAASPYNFAANAYPVVCIYDAGGRDRIDFSGFTGPTRINLAPGSFSDTQDLRQNLSIAFGTVIENANGGSGDDVVLGNKVANLLRGGNGDDLLSGDREADNLRGDAGRDTLIGGNGDDRLAGGRGADVFVLDIASARSGVDQVLDFGHKADQFQLEVTHRSGLLHWTAAKFYAAVGGQAHDATDRIIYDTGTGLLYFDADGNQTNGVDAVAIAQLVARPVLDWTDFTTL